MTVADNAALNIIPSLAGNLKWAESQSGGWWWGRCRKPSASFWTPETKNKKENQNLVYKRETNNMKHWVMISVIAILPSLPSRCLEIKHDAEGNPVGAREEVKIPTLMHGKSCAWSSCGCWHVGATEAIAPMVLPGKFILHHSFP